MGLEKTCCIDWKAVCGETRTFGLEQGKGCKTLPIATRFCSAIKVFLANVATLYIRLWKTQ